MPQSYTDTLILLLYCEHTEGAAKQRSDDEDRSEAEICKTINTE